MKITPLKIHEAIEKANRAYKVDPVAGQYLQTVLSFLLVPPDGPETNPSPFGTKLELEAAGDFLFHSLDVDRIGDKKGELAKNYLRTLLDIARDNL